MAKGDIKIEFTKDFAGHKKASKVTFSRDLANSLLIRGVAKLAESKAVSQKKTKAKAKNK